MRLARLTLLPALGAPGTGGVEAALVLGPVDLAAVCAGDVGAGGRLLGVVTGIEQRQGRGLEGLAAAIEAGPVPAAAVAAVVERQDAAGDRRGLVRPVRDPLVGLDLALGGGLDQGHAGAHGDLDALLGQVEGAALAADVVGEGVVVGEGHIAQVALRQLAGGWPAEVEDHAVAVGDHLDGRVMGARREPGAHRRAGAVQALQAALAVVISQGLGGEVQAHVARVGDHGVGHPGVQAGLRLAGAGGRDEHHGLVAAAFEQVHRLDHVGREARVPGSGIAARGLDAHRLAGTGRDGDAPRRADQLGHVAGDERRIGMGSGGHVRPPPPVGGAVLRARGRSPPGHAPPPRRRCRHHAPARRAGIPG